MKLFTKITYLFLLLGTVLFNVNCKEKLLKNDNVEESNATMKTVTVERSDYGVAMNGEKVELFALKNKDGIDNLNEIVNENI